MTGPNPTQYTPNDKYMVKTNKSKFVGNRSKSVYCLVAGIDLQVEHRLAPVNLDHAFAQLVLGGHCSSDLVVIVQDCNGPVAVPHVDINRASIGPYLMHFYQF